MPERVIDVVLADVRNSGRHGATWREISSIHSLTHSQISASLSALHRQGKIAKLAETRNSCGIYVLPDQIDGRATVARNARQRAQWSPVHPCFDGRPILIGDRIQFTDQLHEGRLTDGHVIDIRHLEFPANPDATTPAALIEVEELQGWYIGVEEILDHIARRS